MRVFWLSVGKFLPSPMKSVVPIPSETFFFPFRFTVFVTAQTLTHLRPGPSGVTGLMGSLFDLMRQTCINGPKPDTGFTVSKTPTSLVPQRVRKRDHVW